MSNLIFIDEPYMDHITEQIKNIQLDFDYIETVENIEMVEELNFDKVVLCIDVGILNLGVSIGLIDKEFNLKEIAYVDLINITKYTHERELDGIKCKLRHTKSIADWMEHIFHEHLPLFQEADYILVERQPPSGLVAIEQLIYYRWRDKCHIISPRSMHKYYNIGNFDYEQRKQKTIYIATNLYKWHQRAIDRYEKFERKHDITDSVCLMAFWLNKNKINYLEKKRKDRLQNIQLDTTGMTIDEWFEQFRYKSI